MELSAIEPWVRFLRSVYAKGRGGTDLTMPVQVSAGFPFTDVPENSNLPNNPDYASRSASGIVRVPGRRMLQPPEITVHDAGAQFPKRYMDNFVMFMYSHDVVLAPDLQGKVAAIKNVMVERGDGSLRVLVDGKHYIFDKERRVITFFVEYFGFIPIGTKVHYTADLFGETLCGPMEIITEGVVTQGEIIGAIYSLEADITLQIDFWGGDQKQTEWLLQRFRNLWINDRKLRQALSSYGLSTMNLSWSHGGIVKNLNEQLRPYLYNISATVKFTTEYRVLELAQEFVNDFEEFSGTSWLGNIVPSFEGSAMRYYEGTLMLEPFRVRMMIPWENSSYNNRHAGMYSVRNTLGSIDFPTR